MQLRAYDSAGLIVFAHQATKQIDYFCFECQRILRLRGGVHRQKHFYHLNPSQDCRQSGKSMEHLQVQCVIKQLFGEAAYLEQPFPSIRRIADCVVPSLKLIFEVQCSFISQKEVMERNADYLSQGFRVVWLLHDKRFNQRHLTAAELWLRDHPHYFTDIDASGGGFIYDQYDHVVRGWRKKTSSPMAIELTQPYSAVETALPALLKNRHIAWRLGFVGDWVHRFSTDEQLKLEEEISDMQSHNKWPRLWKQVYWLWYFLVQRPYEIIFVHLLEKACR